jgi:hypothetical protein
MDSVQAIAGKHVGIVGLGALGSTVALELARNGVGKLTFVDFDFVDPSTVRRWALGTSAFGKNKAYALKDFLAVEYPWTDYVPINMKLGETSEAGGSDQFDDISSLISSLDVVIDLSTEDAANQLLSDLAQLHGKSYVCASATPGAWGGLIFQWRPDRGDRCWMCMRSLIYPDWAGLPPADPEGDNQPPGCPARTFTGSSFDLGEIALEAVRTVVSICGHHGGYVDTPWQLSVCKMRDGAARTLPQWSAHEIPKRPGCSC